MITVNRSQAPMLNGKSLLITGGTGSFGKQFTRTVLRQFPDIRRLVIFSRDELKQYEMSCDSDFSNTDKLRFFIGDIRDKDRLNRALEGIDIVIHAAALKQVPAAEYNPFEAIKTNVLGAQNVIESCLDKGIQKVVALSTDKAAAPVNLYGATKLCSDKLFTAANSIVGTRDLKISVVRYGNVMGSRGSVIPFFLKMRATGILPITHPDMTRFNISLDEGIQMVLWTLGTMEGGEIFVPKIPSYRILDVAEAVCPDCEKPIVGIRPGEKMHEEMITESDAESVVDLGDYLAILPSYQDQDYKISYLEERPYANIYRQGSYSSDKNPHFLSVDQLKALIQTMDIERYA